MEGRKRDMDNQFWGSQKKSKRGEDRERVKWIINEEEVESGSNGLQGEKCFWAVTLLIHLTKS